MESYKEYFTNRSFLISFLTGSVLLAISLVVQYLASNYATRSASDSVTDIVLSNTRVYSVDGIFVWGAIVLVLISLVLGVIHLNYMPFALKSVATFTFIRAIFISLTHISPFPSHVLISSEFFRDAVFNGIFNGNDLFFSGHTGLPFLLALMVWDNKLLRYIFLGFSVTFAVVVLLGHLHYSIDVLSAFFITYTVFDICKFLFKKDWELFSKRT
jgi:hypothetical protein